MSLSRKTRLLGFAALAASAAIVLSACSSSSNDSSTSGSTAASGDVTTVKVGAMFPATDILQHIQDNEAAANGLNLEITEFDDYTSVNTALADHSLDADLYQHVPYMTQFNKDHGTDIVSVGKVYFPALALYSTKVTSLADIPDGSTITLPADAANLGRALLLLDAAGLITFPADGQDVDDITANPHNFQFSLLDAAQLPRALDDVYAGVVNFVYAGPAGLTSDQQLFQEKVDGSPYANVLAVNNGDQDLPQIQTLIKLLNDPQTQQYITDNWKGLVTPVSGN